MMSQGLSLYLDAARFLAAMAVFLEHANFDRITGGLPVLWRLADFGSDAVLVFFVLSGFVIAHVAQHKEHRASDFVIARMARLWSVAVPALLLTAVLDPLGAALSPATYDGWWYQPDQPVLRLLASALFVNELWFTSIRPLSNGPFWSLCYEWWYYLLFAAVWFGRGRWRIGLSLAIVLIAGPKIMVLAPIWWLGVWAYRTEVAQHLSRPWAWGLLIGPLCIYVGMRWMNAPEVLLVLTQQVLGESFTTEALHRSQYFLWAYAAGPLIALNFIGARTLSGSIGTGWPRGAAAIKWLAGITFPLYLFHYPAQHMLAALGWRLEAGIWQVPMVVVGSLAIVALLGPWCEKQKRPVKQFLAKGLDRWPHRH